MNEFDIRISDDSRRFSPGAPIEGDAQWTLDSPAAAMEIRLAWFTQGKGTPDTGVAAMQRIEHPSTSGKQHFSFTLPHGPYSFSGKLISLAWVLEIQSMPRGAPYRLPIVLAPGGSEVILPG